MKALLILIAISFTGLARAQTNESIKLNLVSPLDYQVFQRQSPTNGKIIVEVVLETAARGTLTNLEKLEVQLIDPATRRYLPPPWQPLPFDNRVRHFRGEISAPAGGWYQLRVRVSNHNWTICETNVEHVGVGEVFVVAGQSNAANHGEGKQEAKNPLVVEFGNGTWHPAKDPEAGASGKGGSFMPAFGDAMAARFKVPIGIVAIAEGSTSVREWLPKGDAMAAPPDTGRNVIMVGSNLWVSVGDLYNRIITTQQMLGPNGFRALLWHQGESDCFEPADRQISPDTYRQYLQHVIEASRAAAGWRVPWFVAQASYHPDHPAGSPDLRAAQKSLVTDGIALAGPNTDELGAEWRQNNGKGIHFDARGLQKHGELWAGMVGDWLEQQLIPNPRTKGILPDLRRE